MTAPRVLSRDIGFDRAAAKRDGYTDAEIDAYLSQRAAQADPYKPTNIPRQKASSTAVVSGKPTGEVYANDPIQLARAAAQGATLGFADEAEAAIRAPFSERTYGEIVQDVRAQNRTYADQHPVASGAAQLAGSVATGGPLARLIGGAPQTLDKATLVAKLAQGAKTGAKVGGVTGALTGAGSGETVEDRVRGIIFGGVGGAAFGGAFGAGAEALANRGELVASLRDMAGRTTGDAAKQRALAKLATDLERGSLTVDQVRARLGEVPEDVPFTLLDVGGQNVRDRGMAVAAVPGRGKETLTGTLTTRRTQDGARVVEAFKRATGATPDEVNTTTKAMVAARDAAADAEFDAARKAGPVLLEQRYQKLLDDPLIVEAYGEATDRLARQGKELTPLFDMVEVMTPTGPVMRRRVYDAPSVETLDVVYRELRDKASSLYKSGATNRARDYKRAAKSITKILDDPRIGVPEYTTARQNFANASRKVDARKAGKQFRGLQPEELDATLSEMAPDVAAQYRAGGTRKVFEEVQQRGNRSAVSKVDANDQMRAQNMALAGRGTPRAADLAARLDAERTMADTYNRVLTGSRTTPLKEAVDDLGASQWDKAANVLDMVATEPTKAGILKRLKDAMQNRALAGRGEVAEQLGTMMSQGATSRADLTRLLDTMGEFMATQRAKDALRATVGPRRGAAVGGYMGGRLVTP